MRTARIKIDGHAYYHVMTHLVDGARDLRKTPPIAPLPAGG